MYNYSNFINESRGISNIVKLYTDIVYENFIDRDSKVIFIDLTDKDFQLFNIKLNISFDNRIDFYAKFDPINFKFTDNKLLNIELEFLVPVDSEEYIIKSKITHELTHVLEFYNLVKHNRKLPKHVNLKKIITNFNKIETPLNDFTYFIYLSLDNELNASVSEVYHFLMKFNSKDKSFLEERIKESESWKKYEELFNFDAEFFYNYMIEKISKPALDVLITYLNNQLSEINKNLVFNLSTIEYFKKWEKIFKIKCKKNKLKLLAVIYEVIKDQDNINEYYRYY